MDVRLKEHMSSRSSFPKTRRDTESISADLMGTIIFQQIGTSTLSISLQHKLDASYGCLIERALSSRASFPKQFEIGWIVLIQYPPRRLIRRAEVECNETISI